MGKTERRLQEWCESESRHATESVRALKDVPGNDAVAARAAYEGEKRAYRRMIEWLGEDVE